MIESRCLVVAVHERLRQYSAIIAQSLCKRKLIRYLTGTICSTLLHCRSIITNDKSTHTYYLVHKLRRSYLRSALYEPALARIFKNTNNNCYLIAWATDSPRIANTFVNREL